MWGLLEHVKSLERDLDRMNAIQQNVIEKSLDNQQYHIEKLHQLSQEVASLKEFKEQQKERNRQSWLIWTAVIGCLLTLAGNLVLFILRS